MNRIPSLDGWRGIATGLILFDHIQDSLMGHYMRPWTSSPALPPISHPLGSNPPTSAPQSRT